MTDALDTYALALEMLVAKLQADRCALAAVLLGSLAYDTIWERSDIDLLVVIQESSKKKEGVCLVEAGVNIPCAIATRSEFRRRLEGSIRGSFLHSLLLQGRMPFSRDEALSELFDARHGLADRDRAAQLLNAASRMKSVSIRLSWLVRIVPCPLVHFRSRLTLPPRQRMTTEVRRSPAEGGPRPIHRLSAGVSEGPRAHASRKRERRRAGYRMASRAPSSEPA